MSTGNHAHHHPLPPPPARRSGLPPPPQQRPILTPPPLPRQQLPPLDMMMATPTQQQQQQQYQEWREREHRQRTIRLLMMFLMMLLLMDEDNNNSNNNNPNNRNKNNMNNRNPKNEPYRLRGSGSSGVFPVEELSLLNDRMKRIDRRLFLHRQNQDIILRNATQRHERYQDLIRDKNQNRDYIGHLHEWCRKQMDIVKDEFFTSIGSDTTVTAPLQQIDTVEDDSNGIVPGDRSRSSTTTSSATTNHEDTPHWFDDKTIVHHYPWNTTGFYRGSWKRIITTTTNEQQTNNQEPTLDTRHTNNSNTTIDTIQLLSTIYQNDQTMFEQILAESAKNSSNRNPIESHSEGVAIDPRWVNAIQIQEEMIQRLQYRRQVAAIVPLPYGLHLRQYKDEDNIRKRENHDQNTTDSLDLNSEARKQSSVTSQRRGVERPTYDAPPTITLTRDDGRAAFQLFGKRITGMKELSYVSGFLKLYDSTAAGYSTRKDVLLRVQGVLIHSIGRISLVANTNEDSIAFVIDPSYNSNSDNNINAHRRLQEAVESLVTSSQQTKGKQRSDQDALISIRNEAISLYGQGAENEDSRDSNKKNPTERLWTMGTINDATSDDESSSRSKPTGPTKTLSLENVTDGSAESKNGVQMMSESNIGYNTDTWSDVVIPHPFFHDDSQHVTSPTSKMIPLQEQALEKNAAGCSFEITMDVSEVEYTIGAWKRLLLRRYTEMQMMDPSNQPASDTNGGNNAGDQRIGNTNNNDYANQHVRPYTSSWSSGRISRDYPKEAMVMNMVGEVHSYSCNFHAHINTTALRTDWDATTSKAINYSFYMMVVCLIQIFILLRQLLHSQSQSIATRVSLICIGWQTIIDALLCLVHIYLSLAVQPLFTAFASVAFFKLLIFCVIEMKYMAIILQARNNSNGGPTLTADTLRQHIAALHVRFYVALVAVFLFVFYSPGRNRTYIILALYSFWVPQIILNIITEAKTPLHKHYIYGMSLTRVVAPLYIFGLRNNFLKEVYPDSTTDSLMCQLLILWVGCQAAILIAQGKYGARFMIPKRFLPPKFDYSRPIPASMLPPGALLDLPSPEAMEDRENDGLQAKGSTKREDGDSSTDAAHSNNSRELDLHSMPLRHQTADTTRNRHHRGGRVAGNINPPHHQRGRNSSSAMVREDITVLPKAKPTPAPVLECSICYDNIDVRDRFKYMLAPCNHLYHSECLKQWMDVKMECPICRTPLPPL